MRFRSRRRIKPSKSKRLFTRTAKRTHHKNLVTHVMRGGIRL